ncbi:unnamed protein product [Penicillium pancosmium]
MANHQYQGLALHEIPEEVTSHDIALFLKDRFQRIRDKKTVPTDWPEEYVIRALVEMSVPLFISAATVCRYVELKFDPVEGLVDLIKDQTKYSTKMDKTYLPVLVRLLGEHDEDEKDLILQYFRQIVGSIILLAVPLSVDALSRLLVLQERLVVNLLDSFRSVIHLSSNRDVPVRILHLSFRDFLLQTKSQFYINEGHTNKEITLHCLGIMRTTLKQNICNLENYGIKRTDISKQTICHHLRPELQYSCRYWVHHLEQSVDIRDITQETLLFLQKHFLHWLEAMGTLGLATEVITMINVLQMITQLENGRSSPIYDFLHDAKRFALKYQQMANEVPLQIYCAGLVFAPKTEIIRQWFMGELPPWVCQLPQVDDMWNAELQILRGHSFTVHSVTFSPNGRLLASCSGIPGNNLNNNVQIWDSATGALRQTLKGHSDMVISLAFSPNGSLLATGSQDHTVRLWNPITGTLQQTLKDHLFGVTSLAFSPNGRLLASGSQTGIEEEEDEEDYTLRLWDLATGTLQQTLGGHSVDVNTVAFSSDGQLLASGSGNCGIWATRPEAYTVRIWNMASGKLQKALEGHLTDVNSVAFSPNGRLLASGSSDQTVRLWDPATGTLQQTLEGHSAVHSVAFSPSGQLLASGSGKSHSEDNYVRLWDLATGALLQILQGHSGLVYSVAFSPDGRLLASGSGDKTVRLWDPAIDVVQQPISKHRNWKGPLSLSSDGNLLATVFNEKTIGLWDSVTGNLQRILEGHSNAISVIAFSPNSCLLASSSYDGTTRLWDPVTGVLQHILMDHSISLTFSPNSRVLALIDPELESTIRLWDPVTGILQRTLEGRSFHLHPIAFSPDTKLLASNCDHEWSKQNAGNHAIFIWDLVTGELRQTLKGHLPRTFSVSFSPNRQLLASGSEDNTVRLWNLATGTLQQTLRTHYKAALTLAFSPDSQLLAFTSWDRTIRFWNVVTGALYQTIAFYQIPKHMRFSPDGSYLITNVGVLHVQSQCDDPTPNSPKRNGEISIDDAHWVRINNERALWLPVEFRPICSVVHGSRIAMGPDSGQVSVIGFHVGEQDQKREKKRKRT